MEANAKLSAAESIELISQVIRDTRENLRQNSFPFLLWGWLITGASLGFYAMSHYTSSPLYFIPFPIAALTGVSLTIWYYLRRVSVRTQTFNEHFLSRLWLVLGISFFIVVFINVSQGLQPFTYTMLIAGIGTFVTGLVLRFSPLIIGGIIFLVASLASVYIDEENIVLLQAVAFLCGYLVPGYCLNRSTSDGREV